MLWVAMDGRLVLVVFGVAVLLPYCTVVAATTTPATTTGDQNQTTTEQNVTTATPTTAPTVAPTTATTTDPPSSAAGPIRTTTAPNSDNGDDYSKGLRNGIGIGIGIMLLLVAVTLAVLVTLLWRRQWILPCSADAPAVSVDQPRNVKTQSYTPKVYTKSEPAQDEESVKPNNYSSLQMGGPQETYEPLQDVSNPEETYENPDKAHETRATQRQAKGAEKELPPQRSRPDGGNAKDETDCYRNYFPSENSHRTGKGPNTPHQREKKETKSKETGPQGSASSDDKQAEKRRQGAAARATESVYIDMGPSRLSAELVYQNTVMKHS